MKRITFQLKTSLATLILAGCATTGGSGGPVPKHTDTRMLVGQDGAELAVVDLPNDQALLRLSGVESPVRDKVFLAKATKSTREATYTVTINGRNWTMLRRTSRRWGGGHRWMAFAPEIERLDLNYDKARSKTLDVGEMWATHHQQKSAGDFKALAAFDRAGAEKQAYDNLVKQAKSTADSCGGKPAAISIDWASISDEVLKRYSISGYCDNAFSGLRSHCRYASGKALAQQVKTLRCTLGKELGLKIDKGTLTFTIATEGKNLHDFARKELGMQSVNGKSLKARIDTDRTWVCTDPKNTKRTVIVSPHNNEHPGVSWGDGKTFTRTDQPRYLSDGWFFNPRHINPKHNKAFRGRDLRYYSYVNYKKKDGSCKLVCGTKEIPLESLTGARKEAVLDGATYKPTPFQRRPYALARDRRGVYYFVDRGADEKNTRDFRVYIGHRGKLRRQKMKDIVFDSEGAIFSTRRGQLRLVLGKGDARWIAGRKKRTLQWIPVAENTALIYNELGVYLGAELGVPCDDY